MEITSVSNAKIKEIKALLHKKGREEQGRFIVEGCKCVQEAVEYLPHCLRALLAEKDAAPQHEALMNKALALGVEVLTVSRSVMEAISDVKTPQGIAAVLDIPESNIGEGAAFLAALDTVQDPANVGAIIRTADAAGADGVLLSQGCADVYAPKTLRASMGSAFHIGIWQGSLTEKLKSLRKEGFQILAAHLHGDESYTVKPEDKICLVIGNEANGISEEVLTCCTQRARIPIYGRAESLNAAVAAGILLYGIAGQRRK